MNQYQRIELGFDLDDFRKPICYSGSDAWIHLVLQLCLIEKGTIPSNPTIGVGMKGYDFLLEDDRHKLEEEINRQVPLFYPDVPFERCVIQTPAENEDQDILYLLMSFIVNGTLETSVVAVKKGYNYIDFAIAM